MRASVGTIVLTLVTLLEFRLQDTVAAVNIERTVGFASAVSANIVIAAVVAFLAFSCIDDAIATARRNIGTSQLTPAIASVIDTIVANLAYCLRNNAIAAGGKLAFGRTHIVVEEVAVVAQFAARHDAVTTA